MIKTKPIVAVLLLLMYGVLFSPLQATAQKSPKVSIKSSNTTLKAIISEIEKDTDYTFIFNSSVNLDLTASVDAKDESIDNILKKTFGSHNISYEISGTQIILNSTKSKTTSQSIPITGIITDKDGEPLIGATVKVKGTTIATMTDFDGKFTLNVSRGDMLEASYVGHKALDFAVDGKNNYNLILEPSSKLLEEVVVVGYGTQKKVNLTGSVSTLTADDIKMRPITNVSSGLQGLVPGLTVVGSANGGLPGQSNATLSVRGLGTRASNSPLVLIDGIEGDMNILNPNDIENISVLKDAASASIYGNRAANGVILITTKSVKGEGSKPTINFSSYWGFQKAIKLPKMADAMKLIEWDMEANRNMSTPPNFTEADIETVRSGSDPNYFANTDWIDAVFRSSAPQQNYNVSVNGTASNMGYLMSYGYLDQEGLMVGDAAKSKRHNIRLKLNTRVADIIDVTANISYIDRQFTAPTASFEAASGNVYNAMRSSPLFPVRFTDGKWGYGGGQSNQVAILEDGGSQVFSSQEFTGNFQAKVDIMKGWTASVNYGTKKSNSLREHIWKTINYYYPETDLFWYATTPTNAIQNKDYTALQQTLFVQSDYNLKIDKHNFSAMAGFQQEWKKDTEFTGRRDSLITDVDPIINFGSEKLQSATGEANQWAMRSGFGRINYNYADKYLLEANLRYDLTSRFIKENRAGWFPSFSAAWRASEESFMADSRTWLDQLKPRVSWGILGNQFSTANNHPYVSTIGSINVPTIGGVANQGYTETYIGNPTLVWEQSYNTNFGIDASMFNSRLNVSADYYIKTTKDIIISKKYPTQIGFSSAQVNAGKIQNKGWEIQVDWNDRLANGISYNVSASLSDVRNKVTKWGSPEYYDQNLRREGDPLGAFYGLVADGLAMPWDFERYNEKTGMYENPKFAIMTADAKLVQPGDIKYKDLDGDGKIDLDKDRKVLGNSMPRYTFSFKGYIAYKGVDLSFLLQGIGKADGYIYGPARHAFTDQSTFPQTFHEGRYQASNPNPNASYPRFTYNQSYNQRFSSYWLEDASYLRLKNLQVGYTLPRKLTQHAKIATCRFYASADNLFTISDYFSSADPETPVQAGGNYPQIQTFVFGVNITFK